MIEINKKAFEFLKKNIKSNNVEERYFPVYGDNREVTPKEFASRVLMGYFECDEKQIVNAIEALRDEGWIHLHRIVARNEEFNIERMIERMKGNLEFDYHIHEIRKVKKFSPRLNHFCFDIMISKP